MNILPQEVDISIPELAPIAEVEKRSIFGFSLPKLVEFLKTKYNQPKFRAHQIFEWIYRKQERDPEKMSNISNEFRKILLSDFDFQLLSYRQRKISVDGTRKYLFEVDGGDLVETVMIKQPARMTLCVSSQVGCAIGCKFCQTGTMGLKRNLGTHEIIGQVMAVIQDAKNFDDMFSNIVFMGMGEPLHNYQNVTDALRILRDQYGLAISARKITVSTSGLVPAINKLANDDVDVSLAISLNATTNEVRSKIMPINNRFPLEVLLEALRNYPFKKKETVTIEYVMLRGVNDSDEDLNRLPKLLRGIPAKINLIPYNFNSGLGFESPDNSLPQIWQTKLNQLGLIATIRWSKGPDIGAACGQLVTETKKERRSLTVQN